MTLISAMPAQLLLIVTIALFVAVAVGVHVAIQRAFPKVDFLAHNEVGGVLLGVVGTIYAVLLGFVTVAVWERFNDAADRFNNEAGSIAAVWHLVDGLPSARAKRIRAETKTYVDSVLEDELPAMLTGRSSEQSARGIEALLADIASFKPADRGEANVQLRMMQRLNDVWDDRNTRLEKNENGISWLLWTALALSTVTVFGFSYLFGMRERRTHLIMTGFLAAIAATLFTVLIELNFPFRGNVTVTEDAWSTLRAELTPASGARTGRERSR